MGSRIDRLASNKIIENGESSPIKRRLSLVKGSIAVRQQVGISLAESEWGPAKHRVDNNVTAPVTDAEYAEPHEYNGFAD